MQLLLLILFSLLFGLVLVDATGRGQQRKKLARSSSSAAKKKTAPQRDERPTHAEEKHTAVVSPPTTDENQEESARGASGAGTNSGESVVQKTDIPDEASEASPQEPSEKDVEEIQQQSPHEKKGFDKQQQPSQPKRRSLVRQEMSQQQPSSAAGIKVFQQKKHHTELTKKGEQSQHHRKSNASPAQKKRQHHFHGQRQHMDAGQEEASLAEQQAEGEEKEEEQGDESLPSISGTTNSSASTAGKSLIAVSSEGQLTNPVRAAPLQNLKTGFPAGPPTAFAVLANGDQNVVVPRATAPGGATTQVDPAMVLAAEETLVSQGSSSSTSSSNAHADSSSHEAEVVETKEKETSSSGQQQPVLTELSGGILSPNSLRLVRDFQWTLLVFSLFMGVVAILASSNRKKESDGLGGDPSALLSHSSKLGPQQLAAGIPNDPLDYLYKARVMEQQNRAFNRGIFTI